MRVRRQPLPLHDQQPKPANVPALVQKLKEADEDFEFYPTTKEIIDRVIGHYQDRGYDLRRSTTAELNVLDIGAGHGAFLRAFKEIRSKANLLAIEKSAVLMGELVKFAKVVGTDFHAQSFMSKNVDLVFCNPPYSEYEAWTSRLVRECPAKEMYLVIPDRWAKSATITEAIAFKKAKITVIGSFDFEDAERRARAKVQVLFIQSDISGDHLFEKFFKERFSHLQDNMENACEAKYQKEVEDKNTLVKRDGLVGALVELYNQKLARLQANYDRAASMDADVLIELGLSVHALVTTLRAKLDTLKDNYWTELFGCLDSVTSRLTTKNRNAILESIGGFKAVDFTRENIYAVLLWVIENANAYTDAQILDVFDSLVDSANIKNYKSNDRVYGKGDWRYYQKPENLSHITLDFRLVVERHGGISRWSKNIYLSTNAADFLKDLCTVGKLLGFETDLNDPCLLEGVYHQSQYWVAGKPRMLKTTTGEDFVEVRAFFNGNMHLRMAQKFSLALNVAVGKLRGWIRDHKEAEAEIGKGASEVFAFDLHIAPKHLALTGPQVTE